MRAHGRYRVDTVDLPLLQATLTEREQPAYRTGQVWKWAARGAAGYDEMTNLPAGLRAELSEAVPFSTLALESESRSSDGTVKALFRTREGHAVETVLMRYRDGRRSLCLSSQSGCPLTCTFCATGQMRFGRNLTSSEILDQALHFRRVERVDHAVFMGMGEPMLNFDHVLAAARRLPDVGITHRRTTISTVGWIPGLERFVEEVEEPIRLALSLHAPDDELRSRSHAGQRPLPAGRDPRPVRRAPPAGEQKGLRRVRHARRGQRQCRAGGRSGRAPRSEGLQGEPDSLQPDRDVRGLEPGRRSRRSSTFSTARDCRRRSGSRADETSARRAASSQLLHRRASARA